MPKVTCPFPWYTSVQTVGDRICVRGRDEHGQPLTFEHEFHPKYYITSQTPSKWQTLNGRPVRPVVMDSIYAARDWRKQYEGVEGFTIYGDIDPIYQFIAEAFPSQITYDFSKIRADFFDIEVAGERKFPDPAEADYPINAITWNIGDTYHVFGIKTYGSFTPPTDDIIYYECDDEGDLIERFLTLYEQDYPDIISGWSIGQFDTRYMVNRITKVFNAKMAKRLSPYQRIVDRHVTLHGNDLTFVDFVGVATLDYLELYKKHTFTQQENYRLDTIAHVELGERKLKFAEYASLHELYKHDYQKYLEYNVQDVRLVKKIDAKRKLLQLVCALAYDAKVNYADTFKQVRMWDAMTYYHLHERHVVIPPKQHRAKDRQYVGAYVKESLTGAYNWIASFDVNSLYPALMRQWNISPEKLVPEAVLERRMLQLQTVAGAPAPQTIDGVHPEYLWGDVSALTPDAAKRALWCVTEVLRVLRKIDPDMYLRDDAELLALRPILLALQLTISPNRQTFKTDGPGFLPEIITRLWDERVWAKQEQLKAEAEAESIAKILKERGVV